MQKKYNRFKKLKIKIIKKRGKKGRRIKEKKKKENSIEPQKPNVGKEVYNKNKKCD